MNFRIQGLPASEFAHLAGATDDHLHELGAQRVRVTEPHAARDRISLRDAEPGETVLLLNYEHQPAASPYRSRHAIYVIEGELRLFLREPKEEVRLRPGDTYSVAPHRPHLVTNGVESSTTFLVLLLMPKVELRATSAQAAAKAAAGTSPSQAAPQS